MLSAKQIPKDGYGKEKTLYGRGVRLKAKDLTKTTSTTLKITGMTSGAVHYIDVLVRNADRTDRDATGATRVEVVTYQSTRRNEQQYAHR